MKVVVAAIMIAIVVIVKGKLREAMVAMRVVMGMLVKMIWDSDHSRDSKGEVRRLMVVGIVVMMVAVVVVIKAMVGIEEKKVMEVMAMMAMI